MRALITGATGFVGNHLMEGLLASGWSVRGTSRSGPMPVSHPALEWVTINDVGPKTDWTDALRGVEVVFHLAALAHQLGDAGRDRQGEFERVNHLGTSRLAEFCRTTPRLSRLIFLSSVAAVRSESDTRLGLDTVPSPHSDYGRSKLAGECAIASQLTGSQVDWCALRPPLVYGPRNPGNMRRLLQLVASGVPLPLGGILNLRSFIYVGNLVDALLRCATHPAASRQVFFVSDGADVSTPELVRRIAIHLSSRTVLFTLPEAWMHFGGKMLGLTTSVKQLTDSLIVDASEIRTQLNWNPPFSMDEGLRLTCNWYSATRRH